jgi:transposase
MSKSRGAYRPEFLVRAGRTPAELAGEFDPTAQSIRNWVSQSERNASRGTTQSRPNCSPIPRRSPKSISDSPAIFCGTRPQPPPANGDP